jgi:hypothetical protein
MASDDLRLIAVRLVDLLLVDLPLVDAVHTSAR